MVPWRVSRLLQKSELYPRHFPKTQAAPSFALTPIVTYGAPDTMAFATADTEYPRPSWSLPSDAVRVALDLEVVFQPEAGLTKRSTAPWPIPSCHPGAPPTMLPTSLSAETEKPNTLNFGGTVSLAVSVML